MRPTHRKQTGSVFYALAMVAAVAVLGGILAWNMLSTLRTANTIQKKTDANNLVSQAAYMLSAESSDSDGDGTPEAPVMAGSGGAGNCNGTMAAATCYIPSTSGAPKADIWGNQLRYCAWDHGTTNTTTNRITDGNDNPATVNSIMFAVISAGPDGIFQMTCANAKSQTQVGDDIYRVKTITQYQQGVGGTVYFGDAVPNFAALPSSGNRTGTLRTTTVDGHTYMWNGTTWVPSGIDQNGNIAVAGSLTAGAIAVNGGACTTAGAMARDASNVLYICQ